MFRSNKRLRADEKVLWRGKPVMLPFIVPTLATIPVGLIFLGFAVIWMRGATSVGAPRFFPLFGLPFVLIGLGVTVGPSIWQLMRYRNTEYVITDQRLITQTGAIGLDTRFVDLDKIQEVYVKIGVIDKLFGTGSIQVLTAGEVYVGRGRPSIRPSISALKEPYEVQNILQEAISKTPAKG
ncbi:MAG: PH domain-containing protein [Thermoproteota archaeon]